MYIDDHNNDINDNELTYVRVMITRMIILCMYMYIYIYIYIYI